MATQQSTDLTIPTIAPPSKVNYGDAYAQATSQIAPGIDSAIGSLTPLPGQIRSDASDIAGTYKSEIPTVQNIYSDLAKNLAIQYGSQVDTLKTQQQSDVGQAKVAAAKGGFDTTQGYQAAMISNIKAASNKQIQSVLDQYGVQSDQLMQEASKSISDLIAEAQTAIMQGDTTAADITTKIVGFKVQEQQMITDAANNILSANTANEKAYWAQTYQSSILDIRQQALDLQAQKVGYYAPGSDYGGGAPAPKKAGSGAATKLNISSITSYGQGLGLSGNDIQSAIDYGTQNGFSQQQVEQMLLAASNKPAAPPSSSQSTTSGGNIFDTIGKDVNAAWTWVTKNL